MKNLLKKIYNLNKRAYQEYKSKDCINPQTGLSERERKRLLNYPAFTEGNADFFEKPFIFSDAHAFLHSLDEIFGGEIYRFESGTDEPYIIDCGANIGLSIFYFKKIYPNSKIVAFEPDNKIFNILQENINGFPNSGNIQLFEEAVWTSDCELEFYSEGTLGGSIQVDYRNTNNIIKIKAVDLKKFLNQKVDFLKIDIEGAENEVVFDIKDSLKNVDKLFLEYHGLKNQKQNLGEILNLLKEVGFEYYIRVAGETICFPFCNEEPSVFNQQLNILCYRLKEKKHATNGDNSEN